MKDLGTKSRFFDVEARGEHSEISNDDRGTSSSGSIRDFVVRDDDYVDSGSESENSTSISPETAKDAEHYDVLCTPPSYQRDLDEVYRQNAIDLQKKRSKRKQASGVSGLESSVLSLDRAGRALMDTLQRRLIRFRREVGLIHGDLEALQRLLRWDIEDESFVETTVRNVRVQPKRDSSSSPMVSFGAEACIPKIGKALMCGRVRVRVRVELRREDEW